MDTFQSRILKELLPEPPAEGAPYRAGYWSNSFQSRLLKELFPEPAAEEALYRAGY
jgi:hypothetical protein